MAVIENTQGRRMIDVGRDAWLIAYDIRDPRRLARVHRLLKAQAVPLQYSVFIAWLRAPAIETLADAIESRIDPRQDDVRFYHLPSRLELHALGRQWLPPGVSLFQEGRAVNFHGQRTVLSADIER